MRVYTMTRIIYIDYTGKDNLQKTNAKFVLNASGLNIKIIIINKLSDKSIR